MIYTNETTQAIISTAVTGRLGVLRDRLAGCLVLWHRRRRTRAQLRDLSPYLLDDIGLTPQERAREARRAFWLPWRLW